MITRHAQYAIAADVRCLPPLTHRSDDARAPAGKRHHPPPPAPLPHAELHEHLRVGKGRVAGSDEHKEERASLRQPGNPFNAIQESHKHEAHRGRQVGPRVVDAENIHPSAPAMEAKLADRANAFERGPYTILPDREKPFVSGRRPSQQLQRHENSVDGSVGGVARKPPLRLRDNTNEDRLRRLLPDEPSRDDVRRNYANAVAEKRGGSYLEQMIRSDFPVPRGPHVDCEFPPIHQRPSPRKHASHFASGAPMLTSSEVPQSSLAGAPGVHTHASGRRVFKPHVVPQQL